VIEALIAELVRKGFRATTAKHVSHKGFSMDVEGSDTWHHRAAGANPVIMVSDMETSVLMRDGTRSLSIERLIGFTQWAETDANVLILEGFSSMVLKDRRVGKIICLRDQDEYKEFDEKIEGEALVFCSFQQLDRPVLKIGEDLPVLVERVFRFIEKRLKIVEILGQIADLDCGKCGKATCEELAEDIYEGKASIDDCIPIKLKPRLKTKIIIEDAEIHVQPFVSEVVRKSVLGMLSALKGVTIKGDEKLRIEISGN